MSFVERVLPEALQGQTQAPAKQREPLRRRRLDLIYFALAGFDLLTIGFTLMLSNHIMDLYQQSVNRSAVWSARVGQLVELAQYAQETNAPGNDVFDSKDAMRERSRRDAGLALYVRQRDQVLRDLAVHDAADSVSRVSDRIRTADFHMSEMVREADRIFTEIDAGNEDAAGRRMATMDRVYARLSRSLLDAIITVQQIEDANLQRQVALASELRRLEFMVMGLIFVIVIGVAFYGRRIGQVMRNTEDAHNTMLHELGIANEGLEQYADNVAHELRNPVNKMLLASEVALSRPRSGEEYQDTLVSIVEESQRLSSIVGSLLFLARARRTKVDLERQAIDVRPELDVIRAYFETSAQEAGLRLSVNCPEGVRLDVDRTLFQRVLSNLVSNAIAHTPAGGAISIDTFLAADSVVIEVTDTGEGVSKEEQARVFDRFYRADKARSSTSGRLGLGLPIAKSIMDLHGGAIALRSQLGQGTVVSLTFPRTFQSE
jgi:two-component system, OmpR family, heavy metal sensor histidine kinase CusS